ncbi:MAG: twin-arginine translocase subunit TatC, partial [Candidatus Sulfotelmatobacter sp.]
DVLHKHQLPEHLGYLNPTDPFNLYLKVAALAGLFLTSPFVLYQVWMFISPGLYRNEKKYVVPFMVSTIALFVSGGYFGFKIVYPRALDFLIGFGKQFQPMITIGEYTQLFLSIVLGMGLIFEMPILVFFLALMGIMSPSFMVKNFRYSILVIFIIAAIVTPTPDIVNMCVFAAPMLALYGVSIGVAYMVYPKKDRPKEEQA